MDSISVLKLEGQQLPAGTQITQSVNGALGSVNSVGEYNSKNPTYIRTITYGPTPMLNDTIYRMRSNTTVGNSNTNIVDPRLGFNQLYYK